MTPEAERPVCVICGEPGTDTVDPPRRTFARGADPDDAVYSIIAVLPDVCLCMEHADDVRRRALVLGWCDDEGCRRFGPSGAASPCGAVYKELKR